MKEEVNKRELFRNSIFW